MPLSVNIGLSKKMSRDYQSTGLSVNLTAELDATLLAKPDELQGQIVYLYAQAEQALERQAVRLSPDRPSRNSNNHGGHFRDGRRGDNRHSQHHGNGHGSRGEAPATHSQLRAIESIARRKDIDAVHESRQIIGVELNQLSIKEASELIDHLKALHSRNTVVAQ